jgi:hypothetical protein
VGQKDPTCCGSIFSPILDEINSNQGTLTEREGLVHLTSLIRLLVE